MLLNEWERQMQSEDNGDQEGLNRALRDMRRNFEYRGLHSVVYSPPLDSLQKGLNLAVKGMRRRLTIEVLPQKLFPPGRAFLKVAQSRRSELLTPSERQEVVLVQANWMIGRDAKKKRLQKDNLWLLESKEEESLSPRFCAKNRFRRGVVLTEEPRDKCLA
mmetsp:Transcript_50050/g.125554  ORF Transcript_50050/g.125554 Transcript_50050/m.125554 type:complete len:161 (+) Transcript_50050:210-692(+)